MSSFSIENVNTKLEAYKLVHDPTRLLSLLYSKYGDIEEDYFLLYTNQIFYNVSSHFNTIFKENQYLYSIEEFLKRFYKNYETKDRIPKLSDYYKNYLKFFCRPFFKNYKLAKILNDFEDKKAEIFYKKNYADSANELEEKEKENSDKKSSSSLSSLDNITNNKIIFDKRTKNIIDNNLNTELCTLTLESSRTNKIININDNNNLYNGCLISKRSNGNSSFERNIYSLVHYKLNKKNENKTKKMENKKSPKRKKKLLNSPSNHPPYIAKIFKKNNYNNSNKEFSQKNKKIKKSLYTLARKNYKNNCFISYKNEKGFLSPKINKHKINFNNGITSKFEEFTKNRPVNFNNYIHNSAKKNKTYNNTNNTNSKITKTKNNNVKIFNNTNTNTIYKNFSILSESLNKYKKSNNKNSNITYTNKNNSKILRNKKNNINSTNLLMKSNNNENKKVKKKIGKPTNNQLKNNNLINMNSNIKNANLNLNINTNKPQAYHIKNKTFDFNTLIQNEPLSKYNSNNNFDNFKSLLGNNNQKSKNRKKVNSKFSLIKKPMNEVIQINQIISPQTKKSYNKISSINKSISQNKEQKKKVFYGLNNNSNNINIQQNKIEINSPKGNFSNKKKNNMTFNSDDFNKTESMNMDGIIKNNNKHKSNNKNHIIKNKNKLETIKANINFNNNWKIGTTYLSPLSNYNSNLNKLVKNKNYNSFSNTIRMDNSNSQNNNSEALRTTKKYKINNNNINTNIDIKINNNYNTNNKNNNDLFNIINIKQNENCPFSRNKKHNSSKISNTQSQKEINMKDIHIKTIKNLKSNYKGKSHLKNMTCSNDSNFIRPIYNINCNLNKINSSTEVKNNHIKDVLFNLNKISIKKKNKKFSQRISKPKGKNNFYIKPKNKFKNNRGMLSGDNIFNRKKEFIEIKQNSLCVNNRAIQKDNNNAKSNNTISHERGNSLQIINVNRNINLINKNESKYKKEEVKII